MAKLLAKSFDESCRKFEREAKIVWGFALFKIRKNVCRAESVYVSVETPELSEKAGAGSNRPGLPTPLRCGVLRKASGLRSNTG